MKTPVFKVENLVHGLVIVLALALVRQTTNHFNRRTVEWNIQHEWDGIVPYPLSC